ncbi:glycosyltransferase family 2 protein [Lichenibacterium minor]|uniref:Glycosyltransferase family 2 protein n=1 Tax=Lichenibacterium minor TaxID=2316528 RepID=A0A4Q2U3J9_9HYPH|nr:glycosyltransferase family 2 protein [Lichenibacterium minor]RYC29457.1 glycosyltransferase family 2 protein [Lichenibacterium minor]
MKISVIIPARNAERFLANAAISALDQADVTLEVIVVDDGSTDGTGALVEQLRRRDDRLRVISNPISLGVSAARNQAIAASRGEWIALLDADDEFFPDRLNKMVEEAERRELDMLADNLRLRSESGLDLGSAFATTDLQTCASVTLETFVSLDIPRSQPMGIGFCKPIIKKDFLCKNGLRYRDDIYCAEDFLFYCDCIMSGAKMGFSTNADYLYTVRTGGHGTAFNLQVSQVNRIIMTAAKRRCPSSLTILRKRQHAIDYDGFAKSVRIRKYLESLKFLRRIPPAFIALRAIDLVRKKFEILKRE